MIVRKMIPTDFDTVINISKYYIDEANLSNEWDEDAWLINVRKSASQWERFFFVALDNQRPVGWISGYANTINDWNNQVNAHVQTFYLLNSHRTNENLNLLYENFLEWAKLIQAKTISVMHHEIDYFNNKFENDNMKKNIYYTKEL